MSTTTIQRSSIQPAHRSIGTADRATGLRAAFLVLAIAVALSVAMVLATGLGPGWSGLRHGRDVPPATSTTPSPQPAPLGS